MPIYLSNRVESLVKSLRENLFCSFSSPFAHRLLVVPSQGMDSWVRLALADSGIATGIESVFLDQAVNKLSLTRPLPSRIQLIIALEAEISKIVAQERVQPLWQPLVDYLQGRERRLLALCKQLASLFNRYAIYGEQAHKFWKEEWQAALWHRLFADWDFKHSPKTNLPTNPNFGLSSLDSEEFTTQISRFSAEVNGQRPFAKQKSMGDASKVPEGEGEKPKVQVTNLSVHLFGFSHIPRLHFDFFLRLSRSQPIFFYQLSPCQEFWSDMISEREKHHLLKKDEEIESYFDDLHPLLGNLGRVGRKLAELIEESHAECVEDYIVPTSNTQLGRLQRDLLRLEQSDFSDEDGSIELHLSSTPHREIQNLYHTLLALMAEKEIEPKDILVMAPDITIYEPFIRSVFREKIDYQIGDVSGEERLKPLFLMVELENNRWSGPAVLELFDHPLFRSKQRWGEGDLELIREWIQKSCIRWGVDGTHRQLLLDDDKFTSEKATWSEGINRLLVDLATTDTLSFTDGDLLGQLAYIVENLREDLKILHDGSQKTLHEWGDHLKYLTETYLDLSDGQLFHALDMLSKNELGKSYRFSTFFTLFREAIGEKSRTIGANRRQAVRFFSLLPMRAIPAKVVCLIGMNHDAFPRKERLKKLDLLYSSSKSDYYPSRNDFDRYLFLEAILSARERLILSYQGYSAQDGSEMIPSTVVAQLISYCQLNHPIIHPAQSFDPRYFDGSDPQLKKGSSADFRAASLLQREKSRTSFEWVPREERTFQEIIDINELVSLARYPLKNYFRHQLGMRFKKEEEIKGEEEFLLSPLQMAKLKKGSLTRPLHELLEEAGDQGDFPLNTFGEVAADRIAKEIDEYHKVLEKHQIRPEEVYQKELEPIELEIDGRKVTLIGTVDGVTPAGLLVNEKHDLRGVIRSWPLFLALNCHKSMPLIFSKDGKIKEPFFQDPKPLLTAFVDYYFGSFHSPSPLFPEWIGPILARDRAGLEKKIRQTLSDFPGRSYDESMRWAFRSIDGAEAAPQILKHWSPLATRIYQPEVHS